MEKFKWMVPVRLPKEVVIYNEKLSAFALFIQLAIFGSIIFFFGWTGKSYLLQVTPMMSNVNFYRESMPEAALNSAAQADSQGAPCARKDQTFRFKADADRTYSTFKCTRLPKHEQFMQLNERVGFFPTFFSETRYKHAYSGTK